MICLTKNKLNDLTLHDDFSLKTISSPFTLDGRGLQIVGSSPVVKIETNYKTTSSKYI